MLAEKRKFFGLGKVIQPAGHVAHGRRRSAVFTQLASLIVGIHTVQHNEFNEIRINFFPFKKIADSVENAYGPAVVFGRLVV